MHFFFYGSWIWSADTLQGIHKKCLNQTLFQLEPSQSALKLSFCKLWFKNKISWLVAKGNDIGWDKTCLRHFLLFFIFKIQVTLFIYKIGMLTCFWHLILCFLRISSIILQLNSKLYYASNSIVYKHEEWNNVLYIFCLE